MPGEILELIDEIYECAAEPSYWEIAARKIARAFGAHAVALQHQPIDAPRCGMRAIAGFDPEWTADYLDHWDRINPWRLRGLAWARARPENARYRATQASALTAPRDFRRSAIFNESLKRMDLYDCLALPLFAGDHGVWLAFFCGGVKDLFTPDDMKLARALAPHVGRAARFGEIVERTAVGAPDGYFAGLKSEENRVKADLAHEESVIAGRRDFNQGVVERLGLRLRFRTRTAPAALASVKASSAAMRNGGSERAVFPFIQSAGDLPISAFHSFPAMSSSALRREQDETTGRVAEPPSDAGALVEEYGLTQSEAEIALMIARGLTPPMIADLRRTGLNTVRWHIKQIYVKLRVSSRVALVRKVLAKAA